jgi:hypothetical protein
MVNDCWNSFSSRLRQHAIIVGQAVRHESVFLLHQLVDAIRPIVVELNRVSLADPSEKFQQISAQF